jgi:hypothetical protein
MSRKLPSDFDFDAFLKATDRNPETKGMRVIYSDGSEIVIVREGPPVCGPDLKAIIIKPDMGSPTLHTGSAAEARESQIYSNLLDVGLSCASAAIGWVVVAGSGAAAPVTGGASTFITVLGYAAAAASTAQCGNSVVRVYNEVSSPESNDKLDKEEWYTSTLKVLDAISLVSAGTATVSALRMAKVLRTATGKSTAQVLKGLSRQERRRITEETIRLANPGISNSAIKQFVNAGVYPRRFTSVQISNAVRHTLKEAAGAALDVSGSAKGGLLHDTGKYVIGVAQSFETY